MDDDPEAFAAAWHFTKRGTEEFKGAKAKSRMDC